MDPAIVLQTGEGVTGDILRVIPLLMLITIIAGVLRIALEWL